VCSSDLALVFQGGGSLGAYEAGVFKALYEKITKEDEENGKKADLCLILLQEPL